MTNRTDPIVTKPDWGSIIANKDTGAITELFQTFLDNVIDDKLNATLYSGAVVLPAYLVTTLPDPSLFFTAPTATTPGESGVIVVTNETGGQTEATSNGVNWLRVSDGAIVT